MSRDPEKLPKAIDLSHHLSAVSKARTVSPLKGLQKYLGRSDVIMLAGGLPSPDYFPFSSVSAEILVPDSFPLNPTKPGPSSSLSWLWKFFGAKSNERTETITINKYPANPGDINLATALQYGVAKGLPELQQIIYEFTTKVYQPGYKDFATLVHVGNTDGWNKAVGLLCNRGEGVLAEEWTYPSAMASMQPHGIKVVPVAIDGQGMRSDALRTVLSEWDETARGMPRPHVMYTIPVGQNPTGATMFGQRKKEIYDICVEYDIIIVEDDPYFFLQEGPYVPKPDRRTSSSESDSDEKFVASLAPSYLKFDYQGRVLRLDTFSKTIAPGCRQGWFTCNPVFAERLERIGETSTQNPCGFGQVLTTSLLLNWQYTGYIRWLKALRAQYTLRRDFLVDTILDAFDVRIGPTGTGFRDNAVVYHATFKGKNSKREKYATVPTVLSFVPPVGGMFVFLKLHFENHPSFSKVGYKALEEKLFVMLAENGVLFGPGYIFSATTVTEDTPGDGHFRLSFSNLEFEVIKKAISIFAETLEKFMSEDA